jgi:hypothetical protein
MPALLFAVRTNMNRMAGMGGMGGRGFNPGMMGSSVISIDKRTGKRLYPLDKEYPNDGNPFNTLDINPRNATVEFTRPNLKIVHYLETDDQLSARADGAGEANGDGGSRTEPEKVLQGGAIIEKK